MLNETIHYTIYKIRNATVRPWPFPHLVVDDVFHPDFYDRLIDRFPLVNPFFRPLPGYENRLEMRLHERIFPEGLNPVWDEFRKYFVLNKDFYDQFLLAFNLPVQDCHPFCHLCMDKPGYEIKPHTDTNEKIITALFYMPFPGYETSGTTILNGGEEVLTVPFIGNRLFLFAVTDNTWHKVKPSQIERTSAQFFLLKNKKEEIYD